MIMIQIYCAIVMTIMILDILASFFADKNLFLRESLTDYIKERKHNDTESSEIRSILYIIDLFSY